MIKAEVVPHDGTEVPNWLSKCRDAVTSVPVLTVATTLGLAVIVLLVLHSRQGNLANETAIQSIPATSSGLQVVNSNNLPVPTASDISLPAQNQSNVGPAPTASRDSLQPTGLVSNAAPGLAQAAQSVQNAGQASARAIDNLSL